jgi:hypothetical protein
MAKLSLIPSSSISARTPFKIDIGCGPNKKPGYVGLDRIGFKGVDRVVDLTQKWPIDDDVVDEIYSSHFLEHLHPFERVHVVNEAWRVLKDAGKMTLIVPHWSSGRAYGDPTHVWPPFAEMWFHYLSREWRLAEAPHTDIKYNPQGFNCSFECVWGYVGNPVIEARSDDFKIFALSHYREAIFDMCATLIKIKPPGDHD